VTDIDPLTGMCIDWDVPIATSDGSVLRADVFRPQGDGRWPVLLSYGPYAKGLAFQEGYPSAWQRMAERYPDAVAGSTNRFQNWEVVDPEKWVPDGYVCVRVDSRGCGRSPGRLDPFSARETRDLYECVEWAAVQPWSTGKIGLAGISYYAMNQWQVASLRPPHLAAMCPWEGAADWYRDATHHGGILSTFWANWYDIQVKTVQHGLGPDGPRHPVTGLPASGDEALGQAELASARVDLGAEIRAHPLDDDYHRERSGDCSAITVPLLSAGNWGGQGLHLRGNIEGFVRAATPDKWLEMHGGEHWTSFYTDYGVRLQKRFFGHFLAGRDTGWQRQPPVQLQVRHVDGTFVQRAAQAWPLPETRWTRLYLDGTALVPQPPKPGAASYTVTGDGCTFFGAPLETDTEVTGPLAAKLFVSTSTVDTDVFLVLRAFSPDGEEVVFQGAIDPHTPLAQGWLRASHRALDSELSLPYRPFHPHTHRQPLVPGAVTELDVEILPTCVVLPAGYRIALTVLGHDYVYPGESGGYLSNFRNELTGCGPFLHDDPADRPADPFASGTVTLHTGGSHASYLLLPLQ
jgi:uncharacterized protein